MKAKVDQILTEFVARFRATVDSTSVTLDEPVRSARQNGFSDPLRGQERPLPIAVGTCTDVRGRGVQSTALCAVRAADSGLRLAAGSEVGDAGTTGTTGTTGAAHCALSSAPTFSPLRRASIMKPSRIQGVFVSRQAR